MKKTLMEKLSEAVRHDIDAGREPGEIVADLCRTLCAYVNAATVEGQSEEVRKALHMTLDREFDFVERVADRLEEHSPPGTAPRAESAEAARRGASTQRRDRT